MHTRSMLRYSFLLSIEVKVAIANEVNKKWKSNETIYIYILKGHFKDMELNVIYVWPFFSFVVLTIFQEN